METTAHHIVRRLWLAVWLLCGLSTLKAQDTLPSDGHVIFYYPTGEKSSEGTLVNGKPEGWWRSYNTAGVLISEGNRRNFLLDSLWSFYNDDGKLVMTTHYRENQKDGEQVVYRDDEYTVSQWRADTIVGAVLTYDLQKRLRRSVPYENGKPNGLAKEYNEEGLVVAVTTYYRGVQSRRERINRTDKLGLKQGSWKLFWDNGNLRMEGSYLNDNKHGFFKYYDNAGDFLYVEKYDHGTLVTDAKETKQMDKRVAFHPNGQLAMEATYYKNIPDGIRRDYDSTGKLINGYVYVNGWMRFEGITDENGLRQGLWKEYYPTGELRSRGKYKDSKPTGNWKFFFPDQTVEIVGAYTPKGEKDGEWLWFYPTGDTLMAAHYEDGDLEGYYVEYDEEGIPVVQGNYVAGYEEGVWQYRNGTSVESGHYDGGKKEGLWITTFDPTHTAFEIRYDQDVRDGKYVAYWENGTVKTLGKYNKGLQDGLWTYYNEDGHTTLTTLFKDGKEIKWNDYTIK
ncbi:MAG: hypothetical protein J6T86_00185 [Bacteroidales bacterium]|nr:hypothetical protein [Bacteroidales bacterium]